MDGAGRQRRSGRALALVTFAGAVLAALFFGLGVWQVERLFWKLDLIARIEARVAAEPVPAPGAWDDVSTETHEYLRVALTGTFDHDAETLVQAVTELGPGFWVMTPLRARSGETVLVNRGFMPADHRDPGTRAAAQIEGETTISGLLRLTEPEGGFLRANDPGAGRWFSRDVTAIGAARGLETLAPYFIDADATPNPGGYPQGGLTVVSFRNHHLVYALTWFALAAMVAGAVVFVHLDARRRRGRDAESLLEAAR